MKTPPISPYGTFHGSMFQYTTPFPSLVAFESFPRIDVDDDVSKYPSKKCILLGGLSDGLIPTPYSKPLEHMCHSLGWSLVQPVLSSSYLGFGNSSLKQDTTEIGKLMNYLHTHRNGETFAIVGHSTGCQDAIHFMKHGPSEMTQRTKFIALQAPVSDREGAMLEKNYKENIEYAQSLVADGKGQEMMPRDVFWAPITASRFLALQEYGGEDDFFSSDLSDDELMERLGHIGDCDDLSLLAAFSGSDEYVPEHVDKDKLLSRLCGAMNHKCIEKGTSKVAIPLMIETANHNLSAGEGDIETFVQEIEKLLKRIE